MPTDNMQRGKDEVGLNETSNVGMEGISCTNIEGSMPSSGPEMRPGTGFTFSRNPETGCGE